MVLLSVIFLIATSIFSAEKNGVVWKSSSLAVLFHGLEGWSEQDARPRTLRGMELSAKEMWAKLQEDDRGELKLKRD